MKTITVSLQVSKETIDNAIRSAHCGYWACELVWDGKSGYVVEAYASEDVKALHARHTLSPRKIARGVAELARVSPYIFGKLLDNDLDGPQADVLLQLCAGVVRTDKGHEGEPKYG